MTLTNDERANRRDDAVRELRKGLQHLNRACAILDSIDSSTPGQWLEGSRRSINEAIAFQRQVADQERAKPSEHMTHWSQGCGGMPASDHIIAIDCPECQRLIQSRLDNLNRAGA